jgi:hypothetical protein
MLPEEYRTRYELDPNNETLKKGIRFYVQEIAEKNGLLTGQGEGSLLVSSIASVLKLLPAYGYYAYLTEVTKLPGLMTEARFIVEDKNETDGTAIRAEVTLVSEDFTDYELFVRGQILPHHPGSADRR